VFVLIQGRFGNQGAYVKGIVPELEPASSPFVGAVSEGSSEGFEGQRILLGREAYLYLGTLVGEPVRLLSGRTARDPYLGYAPIEFDLTVAGAFETGLYDFDKGYAFVPIRVAQRLDDRGDVATHVEVEIADLDQSDVLAPVLARETGLDAEEWKDQNRAIFEALKLERLVMFITIGLIVIVASLNIVVTLVMMVMEKARDIAILTAMGATGEAIRRIFVVQGVVIGVLGTALGLVLGNTTAWVADAYRLVSLSEQVYSIAYVPFEINLADSLIVGAGAIFISWASTIYPSRRAAALQPVEAFRYE
jgi:lipoprotein-releasing system permease protein